MRMNFFSKSELSSIIIVMVILFTQTSCCRVGDPVVVPLPFMKPEMYPQLHTTHECTSSSDSEFMFQPITGKTWGGCVDTVVCHSGKKEYQYRIFYYKDKCKSVLNFEAEFMCEESEVADVLEVTYLPLLIANGWTITKDWNVNQLKKKTYIIAEKNNSFIRVDITDREYKGDRIIFFISAR